MSFRLKTIVGIALIEAIFLFILIVNSLSILRQSHHDLMAQRANTLASLLAYATADAVLSTDLATLESMVADLENKPEVLFVKVFGNTGLLAEANGMETPAERDGKSQKVLELYVAEHHIEVGGRVFGRVELAIDTSEVSRIWQEARVESVQIAILEIVLVAFASMLLGYYLTRNLRQLQAGIKQINQGEYIQIQYSGADDEIGQTITAFNDLSAELQRSHEESRTFLIDSKRLAMEVKRREQWLRSIVDNIADAIVVFDAGGIIRSSNHPAQKIFGYSQKELLGLDISLLILDEHQRQRISDFIASAAANNDIQSRTKHFDETGYRRDGTPFPVDMTLTAARVDQEDIFILLLRDLSWQKQIERQAELSETIKSGMLESSLSGVIAIDQDDRIIEFNAAAEMIFGYSKNDVLGQRMAELIMPEQFREAHLKGMQHYLETGTGPVLRQRLQLRAIRKNSIEFPVELVITPIHTRDNVVFTAVIDDITERLETTEKLKKAKEEADSANQAKSQFLASMSHEIRTPLNIILGMLELLKSSCLEKQQYEQIIAASNAGHNLLDIINDVLDLAKIEAGKMEVKYTLFNPAGIVESTLSMFKHRAASKGLRLFSNISAQIPPSIFNDVTFFRQVCINLIGNAIKYTQEGGLVVSLRLTWLNDLRHLELQVRDTGQGISASQKKRIFEEFTQLHTQSDGTTGTGLGLVICRELANLMGGDIAFESEEDQGSVFSLQIPIEDRALNPGLSCWNEKAVLLCSDDPLWLENYRDQLSSWGIRVYACCFKENTDSLPSLQSVLAERDRTWLAVIIDSERFDRERLPDEMGFDEQISLLSRNKIPILSTGSLRHCDVVCTAELSEPVNRLSLMQGLLAADSGQLIATVRPAVQMEMNPSSEADRAPAEIKRAPARARILLVEDSEANRMIASTYMEDAGYEVVEVENGKAALQIVRERAFDLILMDMRMPQMGGVEATSIIRAEHLAESTPILALTAHAMTSEKQLCLDAGMQDFLTKPIERTVLLEKIAHWLKLEFSCGPSSPDRGRAGSAEINHQALEQLKQDTSEAAMLRMLSIFDRETRKRVDQIQAFLAAGNWDGLETSVHALKSSAQTFGAQQLHLIAKETEQRVRSGETEGIGAKIELITTLAETSLEQLEAHYGYIQAEK
ncbi:response regulator receiver and PAS sensor-containing signal transduction histidine kinase [Oleiphilus messinensis]|uniref:Sensory/regulatory protein RpfC n=1 Tax=Oleiphilus messinensis TaxID=141451 RepID=A0A1Y0I6T2_9GAMM|nr:PAS domain S-box protein [Oleiphilus messinensis]ARU55235.1 response regulator receiver and PAS sensor-containing signal transduction histidine kinase [Oleiphilus messinensis]